MGASTPAAGAGTAFAHESVTVDNTSGGVALSATSYQGVATETATWAKRALLTLETAQIRFTYDGTAPTSTVGHVLDPGQSIALEGYTAISNFKAIRTGSTSGTLKVTYER